MDPRQQFGCIDPLEQAAEHFQVRHLVLEVKSQVSTQSGAGPHAFDKGLGPDAIGQLRCAAPADAALHGQRHDQLDAIPSHQPSTADCV